MNRLVCIALLFAILVLAHGVPNRGGGGPPNGGGGGPPNRGGGGPPNRGGGGDGYRHRGNGSQWLSNICNNNSVAQQFPATIQAVISTLEANGSFAAPLAARAQEIAYIKDASNTAVLASNCSLYFSGLQAAKQADQAAQDTARQYFKAAGDLLRQAFQTLTGRGGGGVDSDEDK